MEIGKIDLKQAVENLKAFREADPETMDRIVSSTMKALTSDPDFMEKLVNMIKPKETEGE